MKTLYSAQNFHEISRRGNIPQFHDNHSKKAETRSALLRQTVNRYCREDERGQTSATVDEIEL
ncbi:hypothetical protein PsorP6_007413 [Peronosclerospora sorghi]|uniref:Uncharacterized protein n=1 Tax=Peronosclerospora sorghi TaxID=230839 RepID=A0ACC0WAL0_9STRA|nr:hypothetical protein PsorP6_007413 [Peronosclerospora sorghi]